MVKFALDLDVKKTKIVSLSRNCIRLVNRRAAKRVGKSSEKRGKVVRCPQFSSEKIFSRDYQRGFIGVGSHYPFKAGADGITINLLCCCRHEQIF